MPIDNLRVKNFRSLADVVVEVNVLTIFVGCNDEGKSNLLRALDLFFNGTNGGYQFDWDKDYSGFAKAAKGKAPQIELGLTFTLPPSFNVKQQVVWKQIWRQQGLHKEIIELRDGKPLPNKSKAYAFLKAIRYEYVPAIKGSDYFGRLLGSVHDMLDATVQKDIRIAAASFTEKIRNHTTGILADLESQIGLKSDLELPTDLKQLFSELEFRSNIGDRRVALSQRGDGIKVRHIPIILKWLAAQANHLSAPGKPRVVTIWGYEEPENNLETRRCFELADFFVQNSSNTQTFLTTHSPVFYSSLRNSSGQSISLAEVKLDQTEGTKVFSRSVGQSSDLEALHSSIGFLDLLEPHVLRWKEMASQLESRLNEGLATDQATVFAEGPSDRTILEAIFRKFHPSKPVRVNHSRRNGGGHAWVKDSLIAWHHSRPTARAVGLFDGDAASAPSIQEFVDVVELRATNRAKAFKHRLRPAGVALEIVRAGIRLETAIEEICPIEMWAHASAADWLEQRSKLPQLYEFDETDVTFNDWLHSKLGRPELVGIASYKVRKECKQAFAAYLAEQALSDTCAWDLTPLEQLANELLRKLELLP